MGRQIMNRPWRAMVLSLALLSNIATGAPLLPPLPDSCNYTIALYDSYGDGWNGCKLDVLVDGIVKLDDITLAGGFGPAVFSFPVLSGAQITTIFVPGTFSCEPYYYVYDSDGQQVFFVPNNCNPVITAGQLAGNCPAVGAVEGYVFNYNGLAISGAIIGTAGGSATTSGPNGYYLLFPVQVGNIAVACGKAGYNPATDTVAVILGDTATHNFILTQPNMVVNPLYIEHNLNPNEYLTTSLNILNNGSGPLNWSGTINYISQPLTSCQYSIQLFDTYGDGWNGGTLDVNVAGALVLDNITLASGFGPATFYFDVTSGDGITTAFTSGSWIGEPYYRIFDSHGAEVWYSPAASTGPPDVLPGQLSAACGGSGWLSMDISDGKVQGFGGVTNIPTHLDASNTNSGEVYEAQVVIASSPNVGTITVPVTMIISGNPLMPPENLEVELTDDENGTVSLSWEWNSDAFQAFLIKRDGIIIGTTTAMRYTDILQDHGVYCYTVQTVYSEGTTAPAGPECIEWLNPDLLVEPNDLHGWVWDGNTVDVNTTIFNNGEGMLAFSFPLYAAMDLIRDTSVLHNLQGTPEGLRGLEPAKGDESLNGSGFPVVLGAGGPDDFGYVWIDSDESGGPPFSWTDISTTGTVVNGLADDNVVGPFSIGFDFPFYGETKSQFWVNSNGTVGFTSTYISLGNTSIPTNSSTYKDFIAWMWDDLVCRSGQSMVYYQQFAEKTIIQFSNYGRYGQTGGMWAQIILYRSGKVLILYDQLDAALSYNSCTVGIQSSNPGTGLQVVYNNTYLHNDLAVMINLPADFIVDVEPAWGTLNAGNDLPITITYDSEGYDPGEYSEDLLLESNDPDTPGWIIENTMHVYTPARFKGTVSDNDNGSGLSGVTVIAGAFRSMTDDNGNYSLFVDEGAYDVVFSKTGYMSVSISDTLALQGTITPIDVGMWDVNYAPAFVTATVHDNETWCGVTWALPQGPYEIGMDDGDADDFIVFAHSGSWNAVKFTPAGYPSRVIGGKIFVGDDEFPGQFLGTEFGVAVFAADGPGGMPGTMLDSAGVTVNNYGWVSFDWLDATIESGDFYLAMYQSENAPQSAPLGIDTDIPTYFRSYTKFLSNAWSLSAFQDFMMRAWVTGPQGDEVRAEMACKQWRSAPKIPQGWQKFAMTKSGTIPRILPGPERNDMCFTAVEGMNDRDVQSYRVARYSNFDPNGSPTNGSIYELGTTGNLQYNDYAWAALPQGWYAYGVKALYTSGLYSTYAISNVVGHLMEYDVTINVVLSTGLPPEGVVITVNGMEWPYATYTSETDTSGQVILHGIWKGIYEISAFKIGYDLYMLENFIVHENESVDILLNEKKYAPSCLLVDPLTLEASWCEPLRTALEENFEQADFPPAGWQASSKGEGWFRTNDGGSNYFLIPSWDSFYACDNDDAAGSTNAGDADYLVTPPLDLRECEGYVLTFDSYYDGMYGQLAFVEYSLDGGVTWEVASQMTPASSWSNIGLDLSMFSGPNGPSQIWLAFHADDAGAWASGWAVDNVTVQVPVPAASYIDFYVFLDDVFSGSTVDTTWNYAPLTFGQEYVASVAARYSSGLSSKDYYRFNCRYLYPPRNLTASAPDDAAILNWDPPDTEPVTGDREIPANLFGYNIYRDGQFVAFREHVGGMQQQIYVDENLEPGLYSYTVTALYDLAPYGFPGETGESMEEGPATVTVDYCYDLEFLETWDLGNFDANQWMVDGANWQIEGQEGNPAPAALFSWNPVLADYSQSLTSYPFCAIGMTEGKIWLDFDIKLKAFQPTGEELLDVQVWNWEDQYWTTVAMYSNADGSFDWTGAHINIRALAMDKVFKVRFRARGSNSLDILGWQIDNIHVYRQCDGPVNLTAEINYSTGCIELNWDGPGGGNIDQWIHWDDGVNYSAVGTGGAVEFDVAARWEPTQLSEYEGYSITEVAFFPTEASAGYTLRIWTGAGAASLVVDQPVVNPLIGQWNSITLNNPVPVNGSEELWVGYHVNSLGGFPAGCDDGPALDGYGNMINFGGWQTLLQINPELDYNWNIQAHVQSVTGATMPLSVATQDFVSPQGTLSLGPNCTSTGQAFNTGIKGSRELAGFNVWLSVNGGDYILIDFTSNYHHEICDVELNTLYCFMMSAVWMSETDECESAASNVACAEMIENIQDQDPGSNAIRIFPNPACDLVHITSVSAIKRVILYNSSGQIIEDKYITKHEYILDVSGFANGVYLVRLETDTGLTTGIITVHR